MTYTLPNLPFLPTLPNSYLSSENVIFESRSRSGTTGTNNNISYNSGMSIPLPIRLKFPYFMLPPSANNCIYGNSLSVVFRSNYYKNGIFDLIISLSIKLSIF